MSIWGRKYDAACSRLFGKIIGGTALFALITYAQVMKEI